MKSLLVLSRLMGYPDEAVAAGVAEMRAVLDEEGVLPAQARAGVEAVLQRLETTPLLDLQEEYVATFDRGRALSLHLFEHVHGESRDRGQAMVELMQHYAAHGLELGARELPDYLPLMLEFLSTQPPEQTQELLGDAMPAIVLLGARLREQDSIHARLFEALEALVDAEAEEREAMQRQAAEEGPDETITRMDEIWQEEQVVFMGNADPAGGCGSGQQSSSSSQETPLQWVPPDRAAHPRP
ncbi:nitrate reductase molybdenum cofactor assembly chaperone [Algiphilus aromaticivorans]|uniref:nitrate reductase molybdenum cofactor assembly chaperone n=1 Tax=Algiphilus aromaticivorans TaxID=382454 RepID=UPI0005C1B482|nr:nitrate reductase molybdenum cofactor assembly chaperone [Algiphilus aromaticivorans]